MIEIATPASIPKTRMSYVVSRLLTLLLNPASVNVLFAAGLKAAGLLFSVVIVGVSARSLSQADTSALLMAFSMLVPLGLIQAGTGAFVLRSVSHSHARGDYIGDGGEVRAAFWGILGIGSVAALIICMSFPTLKLSFLVPVSLVLIAGMVFSVADQVRAGTERSWSSNVCMLSAYLICSSAFAVLHMTHQLNLLTASLVAYGAPGIASMLSFVMLLRDERFAKALSPVNGVKFRGVVGAALPILMISVASAILVNLPLSGKVFPWYPIMNHDDAVLFRLSTIIINAFVFLSAPAIPTILRYKVSSHPPRYLRSAGLYFAILAISILIVVSAFAFGASIFSGLWLGHGLDNGAKSLTWGAVLLFWLLGAVLSQFSVLIGEPRVVAICALGCDLVVVLSPLALTVVHAVDVEATMICGLTVFCSGPIFIVLQSFRPTSISESDSKLTLSGRSGV